MSDSGNKAPTLLAATFGSCAIIRVMGRGSYQTSPVLKQYCTAMLDKGYDQLAFDMNECTTMDSTFMGVLAGVALRLRQTAKHRIVMVNLHEEVAELLQTLGLDKLIATDPSDAAVGRCRELVLKISSASRLDAGEVDKKTAAETVLQAHEALVSVSPANLPRFRDVLECMKAKLKRGDAPND